MLRSRKDFALLAGSTSQLEISCCTQELFERVPSLKLINISYHKFCADQYTFAVTRVEFCWAFEVDGILKILPLQL
jgi:hypothetical protein